MHCIRAAVLMASQQLVVRAPLEQGATSTSEAAEVLKRHSSCLLQKRFGQKGGRSCSQAGAATPVVSGSLRTPSVQLQLARPS